MQRNNKVGGLSYHGDQYFDNVHGSKKEKQMVKQNNTPNLSDSDIYYNILITNSFDDRNIQASYSEQLTQPVLWNQSLYKMAVARFDMPTSEIPKFLFQDNTYSVTLVQYNAGVVQDTQQVFLNLTQTNFASNTNSMAYFDAFIRSINDALETAFNALNQAGVVDPPDIYPEMVYNPATRLFSLYCPVRYADVRNDRIEIYFNYDLYKLFPNLLAEFRGYQQANGQDFRLMVQYLVDNIAQHDYYEQDGTLDPAKTDIDSFIFTQETPCFENWYQLYKIVLLSGSMNMRREFVGRLTTDGRTIKAGIVSDFDYSFDQANPCSRITYIPQPNFRWMDLQTDHDLSYIDLKLFYETKDGDLVPVELRPGETLQVKLVFEKL